MQPVASQDRHNLCALMRRRLPAKIFNRLREIGRLADATGASAYLVGGLVRDLLLGHTNLDVDIAVEGDGMAFARRLADQHGAGLKIFEKFATAYVVFPDRVKFDIANTRAAQSARAGTGWAGAWTLPSGGYCSIEQDLSHRDFTINALALRLDPARFGQLIDLHSGVQDLKRRLIRARNKACFLDDPARAFRAVRFEQRFRFRIETAAMVLLKDSVAAGLVGTLPGHRVKNELFLLLAEKDPPRAIRRLGELNLLPAIHPDLAITPQLKTLLAHAVKALVWWARRFPKRLPDRPLIYFMALVDKLSGPTTDTLMKRLVLPERQAVKVRTTKNRLGRVARGLFRNRSLKPSEIYRLLLDLPDEALVLLIAKAPSLDAKRIVTAYLMTYSGARLAINGKSLAAMGLHEGPIYKMILDSVLNAKLDGKITTEREERDMALRLVQKAAG